ncbi:alpha/beta hydrolase [Pseudomonas silvicola]|nr:alpha/beta hydrolase [Pseudomonas silvicola]
MDIRGRLQPYDIELEALAKRPRMELSHSALPGIREIILKAYQAPERIESTPGITAAEHYVPGLAGQPEVRVLVYTPQEAEHPMPAILHIHGGGFVMGKADQSDRANRSLARQLKCMVVSVDYRLAPEASGQNVIDDCYAAFLWLHTESQRLNIDQYRIAVIGESAGGGLAAGLCLRVRDSGGPTIAYQAMLYPTLDDRTGSLFPAAPFAGQYNWSAESNRFAWEALLGHAPGEGNVSAYMAPGRAQDLRELPPAFIAIGALDLSRREALDYAQRLMEAGVAVELHVYPGAMHGFDILPDASVSKQFESDRLRALTRAFSQYNGPSHSVSVGAL